MEGNALAVDHLVIEDDDYLSTVVTPNETRQPWPEDACIHELMFRAAEEHPGAICLQGAQEYTYDPSLKPSARSPTRSGRSTRTTASRCCWSGTRPWSRRFMVF